VTSFSDQSNFKKSKRKFKKAFKEIRNQNLDKVILDVRNNGGGAIKNIKHLTRYLIDEEYLIVKKATIEQAFKDEKKSWFQKILFSFTSKELVGDEYIMKRFSKKMIKPQKKLYQGELVVLINESSYSAAALTPALLRAKNRATLIGEEAGGSYHLAFAGSSKYVRMKNSKIKVRVPIIQLIYELGLSFRLCSPIEKNGSSLSGYEIWLVVLIGLKTLVSVQVVVTNRKSKFIT